jgi:hypothetical protein
MRPRMPETGCGRRDREVNRNENFGWSLDSAETRSLHLETVADLRVFGVDLARETVQSGDDNKREKGGDQGIFDEILAGFIVKQVCQKLFHWGKSSSEYSEFDPLRLAVTIPEIRMTGMPL